MPTQVHTYRGLQYTHDREVYAPHDDTWLFVDALLDEAPLAPDQRFLEVGCGAGLGLMAALTRAQRAQGFALDRNPAAVRLARANAARNGVDDRCHVMLGDLMSALRGNAFDWVLFNPPYLPTAKDEHVSGPLNWAFDGGKTGNETILRFIKGLPREDATRAGQRPEVLLITSSLNDQQALGQAFAQAGYDGPDELGRRAFPFERLYAAHWQPL